MYTYYAQPLSDYTLSEIRNGEAGEVVEFEIETTRHFEQADESQVAVTVVAPKGYELTEADYQRIGELVDAD